MTQPKLRFDGFDGDWQSQTLDQLATFSKGNGYSKGDLTECGDPIILYGSLYTNYQTAIFTPNTFVKPKEKSIISTGDEVIVPASGETAQDIARASAVMSPNIILGGDLNIIKPNKTLDNVFLALALSCGRLQKELSAKAQGKSVVHLRNDDLKKLTITYPAPAEQTAIGNFFRQIDELITLHQNKLNHTKALKKGLLQKMFPKNGETVPELRFPEFSGDWERCKLGDLLIERNTQQPQSKEYPLVSFTVEKGVTPKTERYEREQLVVGDKLNKKYKVTKLNDIVYNPANLKFGAIARNTFGKAVFSPIYITFEVDTKIGLPEFIESYVTRKDFIQYALKFQQGTVYERQSVSVEDFLSLDFLLPSLAEQTAIGNFFHQLDELIALRQRKLEHLKELKKALLQQMFV